ncbi:MAG: rhomboid family intramembrane serine protease [Firmicutes bacterium]|nr:rhomboid family intramembrane serine protease [Bacillota bacterium]
MTNFLENLYKMFEFANFEAVSREPIISDYTGGYTFTKEDGTSICILKIVDLSHSDESVLKFLCEREMASANMLITRFSNIQVVFLLVDGDSDILDNMPIEFYHGQSPCAIYWHIDTFSKVVTVPQGQPNDVMGIKSVIDGAFSPLNNRTLSYDSPKDSPSKVTYKPKSRGKLPICTFLIAITNILILAMMYLQGYSTAPIIVAAQFGAIVPRLILEEGQFFRLFTAIFVHFGWMHLVFNIAGLLIFGVRIERYYGKLQFLAIYVLSGLAASVASLFLTQGFSAGASGAVYGLVGAAFAYTRLTKKSMDMINYRVVIIYIIFGLAMGFVTPNTDFFGHIGGLIAGILLGVASLNIAKLEPIVLVRKEK